MDAVPQAVAARRPLAALVLAAALAAAPGCVTTFPALSPGGGKAAPPPVACQVVTTWQNQVYFAPDTTKGGMPTPGFVGRLYLFGPEIDFPLPADGAVTVDLYVTPPGKPDGELTHLEQWRIDKETLKRLRKRDVIGEGYTLFLPWGSYRHDLTSVRLKVRYDTAAGTALYCESGPLTLNPAEATPVYHERVEVGGGTPAPGAGRPGATVRQAGATVTTRGGR
jgi:hypothetical protein